MGKRVPIMLRASDEVVNDIINPLKDEGRLNKIVVAALTAYGNDPAMQRYLDDGVSFENDRASEELTAMLDEAIDKMGDSALRSERARVVMEDGAEQFNNNDFSAQAEGEGTVTRSEMDAMSAEMSSMKEMLNAIHAVVVGGEFTQPVHSTNQGIVEEPPVVFETDDVISAEPIDVDIDFSQEPAPEKLDVVEEEEPAERPVHHTEAPKRTRPVIIDDSDDDDGFNYTPADAMETKPEETEKKSGQSRLSLLAKSANMGGL